MRQRWVPALMQACARAVPLAWLRTAGLMAVSLPAGIGSFASNLLLAGALLVAGVALRLESDPLDISPLVQAIGVPAGLHVSGVTMRWAGPDRQTLTFAVNGAAGPAGGVDRAEVLLAMPALTQGRAEPLAVTLTGLRLALVRAADGTVHIAGMPPGTDGAPDFPSSLLTLRRVRIKDATVTIDDPALGTLSVSGDAEATRDSDGITGRAAMHLVQAGTTADVTVTAKVMEQATQIDLVAAPTELTSLLAGMPHLAGTAGQIGMHATLTLTPALMPAAAAVQATMGPGRLVVNGVPLPFRALDFDMTGAWAGADLRPTRVDVRRATVTVASAAGATTVANLTAQAGRDGDRVMAEGTVALDRMALADLSQFWPKAWEGNARPWIVENISGGTARDGHARFAGSIQTDGTRPAITALNVSVQGDDVTVAWLRPVPPVQHAQATLTMTGPDVIEVRVPTARQGAIPLTNGLVRITGLSVKDQDLSVVAEIVNGSVPEILTLLKNPRLELLSKHPIPVERPAGVVRNRLEITLPLEADLQAEQVGIHAAGQLTALRLGGLVAGRDIDHGQIDFDVTQDGLRASGNAYVAGVPSQVAVTMDFRAGPPGHVMQTATLNGRATPRQLAGAGLDAGAIFTGGSLGVMAELTEREGQGATIQVAADLAQAQLRLLGWRKEPGAGAGATATVQVKDEHLTGIPALHVVGPDLLIDGMAEMVGDAPSRLVLARVQIGQTRAAGVVDLPADAGGTIRAQLQGTVLDLSKELGGSNGAGLSASKPAPFVVDLRFDAVRLMAGSIFTGVSAHAEYDGTQLRALRMQTAGPERLQAQIAPGGPGRRLTVRSADGGAVLRSLGVTSSLVGGALAIDGQFDDRKPDSPLDGTVDISAFHIRDAPIMGKILQALSLYGIPEALSGPGLRFSRLIAPFVWDGKTVHLGESQAYSASLGLTAKGVVNVDGSTLDLTGTVVPLYVLNAALGRVPLVGRLFSPEQGGGLFAVGFSVRGPLANPSVSVNPLSAVTPGLARRLFRLFN